MKFNKYVAAGNDFIAFSQEELAGLNYNSLAKAVCHRQFGLGADGILISSDSQEADIKMLYYNSDGSQGEMCGNGIRSFGKFIYEEGLLVKENILVETLDGIKELRLSVSKGKVQSIRVAMGQARTKAHEIPVGLDRDEVMQEEAEIDGHKISYSAVRLGVPHMVIFQDRVDKNLIDPLGSKLEKLEIFPEKINVNFVEVLDRTSINIYTWERGAGRTLGCGTGSSSAVFLGNKLGLLDEKVEVRTEGGRLLIELGDNIYMTGSAELVARGEYYYEGEI